MYEYLGKWGIFLLAMAFVIVLYLMMLPPVKYDYAAAKAQYDKDPYMQVEVWDNSRDNISKVYTVDSIYSRKDSCIVFREVGFVNRTVVCGDNIVVTKKEF